MFCFFNKIVLVNPFICSTSHNSTQSGKAISPYKLPQHLILVNVAENFNINSNHKFFVNHSIHLATQVQIAAQNTSFKKVHYNRKLIFMRKSLHHSIVFWFCPVKICAKTKINQNSQMSFECLSILWALYKGCQAIRDILVDRLIEQMSYFVLGARA